MALYCTVRTESVTALMLTFVYRGLTFGSLKSTACIERAWLTVLTEGAMRLTAHESGATVVAEKSANNARQPTYSKTTNQLCNCHCLGSFWDNPAIILFNVK
jgi:hypothetical protein